MEQQNYPQKIGIKEILSIAFNYWNRTLLFQFVYSLLYLSLFFFGYFYLFRYFGLWNEFSQYSDLMRTDFPAFNKKMEEIAKLPKTANFALSIFVLLALINPLNVGFYKVYRKLDLGEKPEINDLFAGYLGFDFFKFFGFYLFWIIIFSYANSLFILGIVWFFITLFSIPLMFFMNVSIFQSINLTVKGLRKDLITVMIGVFVAFLFSMSGILLFGLGFLFTFPFGNAMIYSLYQHYYKGMG
jgi:hypothetical protein